MKRKLSAATFAFLLGGVMSAQIPHATVNDYLSEVRIFPPGTSDFAQIAAKLGVDVTLPTLGAGASLVVAIRNDSGGEVEARILFQVTKNGRTQPHDFTLGQVLAAGDSMVAAPREVSGLLAGLVHPAGKPGLFGFTGSPTGEPLVYYEGATATASIDSVTLADGKFIGADTQNIFDQLVAEDKAKRKFFSDVSALLSTGPTQAQIEEALTARRDAVNTATGGRFSQRALPLPDTTAAPTPAMRPPRPPTPNLDVLGSRTGATLRRMTPADLQGQGTTTPPDAPTPLGLAGITESGLWDGALMQLKYFGMASLASWVTRENSKLTDKPGIHK